MKLDVAADMDTNPLSEYGLKPGSCPAASAITKIKFFSCIQPSLSRAITAVNKL
jgi:hypothetical protein